VRQTVNKLQGAFAIAVICADYDELIIARQQAPLTIGFGQGEFSVPRYPRPCSPYPCGTDAENGELARLTPLGVEVYNSAGDRLKKTPHSQLESDSG